MSKRNRFKARSRARQLAIATILCSSAFPMVSVLADGTSAGTSISNTANATYEDPVSPGSTINATSNTVVVTVAEVAGITVVASGITDTNGGQVQTNDVLNFDYTITNVGNDPTRIRIPNLATATGPGQVSGNLQVSYDGGATWTPITGTELITTSVPAGGSILVRVPVTVQPGAQPNDMINVTLGDTPGNAQNQARTAQGGDVYTVDNVTGAPGTPANEVNGNPVNGVREASDTQDVTVASTLKTYTLATVLKDRTGYNNANTPAITDDTLDYGFGLRVESTDPTGNGITPAPLVGTNITLDGTSVPRILVSDAIPPGTELNATPIAPPGWIAVYSTTAVTTNANMAQWKRFPLQAGDTLPAVTRVGFVNDPAVVSSVAPGTTVNGFSMQLKVRSTATSPLTVNNIAQLFGKAPGATGPQVFDESGDQSPSNYDGANPPAGSDPNGDGVPDPTHVPTVTDGYIDTPAEVTAGGLDTGNNNNGTGPAGEINQFIIQAPVASSLQNGPESAPGAIGPTTDNDDFTNRSAPIQPNTTPGTLVDPGAVSFTNTVKNNGTSPGTLVLQPTPPATPTDLPNGSTVTLTYGSDSVVYTYNNGTFTLTTSTRPGNAPITVPNFQPNDEIDYGVEINLPPGTPLSTDVNRGFPVPILATLDTTPGDTTNPPEASNVTIDRVYTGYLKMVKESRILPGTGPAVVGSDGTFSGTPKTPAPGNIIEYRVRYSNITEPQSGTGNVTLDASRVVISEDGTLSVALGDGLNNWAKDNDTNNVIDTSNVVGSATNTRPATITFFSGLPPTAAGADQTGTTANTDVTKYVVNVTGVVGPGQVGDFIFQRKMN
jgi:hypothetical protein